MAARRARRWPMPSFDPGRYLVRVTRVELGESPNKGTPQVVISFVPQWRIDPNDPEERFSCPEYERSIYRSITAKTLPWVGKDLATIGYHHSTFAYLSPDHPQYSDFAGVEFEAECEHEIYNNKPRERWQINHGAVRPK